MTRLSCQKTFYAKTFESVLRNYFKCPSKTAINKPTPYLFLQNKDNKTGFYRTVGKGLSDVVLKSYFNGSMAEIKYLTFFPYVNKFNGAFTIGKEHWHNFINAINFSGENTIWGIFCNSENSFVLAHNESVFIRHDIVVETEHYIFDAYEVCPQDYILFTRCENSKDWIVECKGQAVLMSHDNQYNSVLPENAECFPLPRIGKKCMFCVNGHFIEDTFTSIANQYHGSDTVDNFITKLRRNKNTNKNQIKKELRMKSVEMNGNKVAVIPEDFTETDVIEWQKTHLVENKTDTQDYNKNRMKEYRRNKK